MRLFQETRKRWNVLFSDEALGVDLRQAVKDGDKSNPCEDGLRSVCWRAFLLYGPPSHASWPKKLAESRSAYTSLRHHFLKYIDHPDDLQSAGDPLADDDNSPWSSLRQDEANRQEIFQDVERCLQDNYFFREPSTKKKMLDILFIYSKLNPDTGYRQGMHEILAPVLWVVECDTLDASSMPNEDELHAEDIQFMKMVLDSDYVEHDSFNLFCAVMQTTKSFYEMGHAKDSSPIVAQCHRIHEEILAVIDPALANHLQVIGILPQVYLIRWLRLLFGREFDFDEVLRVWDVLFAESISLSLIEMTCIAMLLRIRWELMEADYSAAFTLLLRYSLPRPASEKPAGLVRDALYLDQNRTSKAGAQLILDHSGKSLIIGPKHNGREGHASIDSGTRSPSHVSQKSGISATGRSTSARFLPQQKGLESLFQEVSGNIQKRTEGWNLSKTIQGAVSEVKRNMNNSLVSSPQRPRVATLIAEDAKTRSTDGQLRGEALMKRVTELEERNKALAGMLDNALTSLRSVKLNEPSTKSIADDVFNISLAKIQFVSVYLSDSEIPIPPTETTLREAVAVAEPVEVQQTGSNKARDVASTVIGQSPNASSETVLQPAKLDLAPGRTSQATAELQKLQSQPQQQQPPQHQQRPSLAESSFSFMLGEGRHRSSFVSSIADVPEQKRVEQKGEAETKSRPKQMAADSKKEQQRESRGSVSEDDGFTMSSLRGASNNA